ncbi:MAG: 4-hydroxy-tetrahydrodipicolinate reductase [Candidatus Lokiarchaeota archaeon]|nr:4-hydroxy-tetrahydrodipicolinate reductase [Candidatus Lokiarchaeota archaeon]
MIKLLILGPTGSMGKLISKLAIEDDEIEVVAACDVNNIDNELGFLIGLSDPNKIKINDVNNLQEVINKTHPDVVVDFTVANATEKNCLICVENGIRCVIGTTAMSEEFLSKFKELVVKNKAPAVLSPNMATGVNVLFKMASILTEYLADWEIEVIESHHHRKADVPSGTALMIANTICDTLECDPEETLKFGRSKGPNKRKVGAKNEIGIHSIRAGDIVGDHTILYAGPGERIELKHQAHSRECFAEGAIKAIKFIAKAKEIKIYSTSEILGL